MTSQRYRHVLGEMPGRLRTLLSWQRHWMRLGDLAGPTKPGHEHRWLASGLRFPAVAVAKWVSQASPVFGPLLSRR